MTHQRFLFAAALLLALASGPRADETATAPEEPKPIFTRQGRFSIPFRVDAPAEVAPPAKVRLFVSEDGGTRWHLDAEVPPSQQRFDFRSLHDGEYWFTIRSIDAQGRSYPDGAYEPQLRVIVDTLAPRLDLLGHARSRQRGDGPLGRRRHGGRSDDVQIGISDRRRRLADAGHRSRCSARRQDDACRRNGLVAAGGERKDRAAGVGRRSGRQSGRQPIPARSRCRHHRPSSERPRDRRRRRRSARQLAVPRGRSWSSGRQRRRATRSAAAFRAMPRLPAAAVPAIQPGARPGQGPLAIRPRRAAAA